MPDTDRVLAGIDEALAWEAGWEHDAMRWTPDLPDENPRTYVLLPPGSLTPEQAERLARLLAEAWRPQVERTQRAIAEAVLPAMRQVARALADLGEKLTAAGLVPEPVPADPRARALAARRDRNTGPARGYQADRREIRR